MDRRGWGCAHDACPVQGTAAVPCSGRNKPHAMQQLATKVAHIAPSIRSASLPHLHVGDGRQAVQPVQQLKVGEGARVKEHGLHRARARARGRSGYWHLVAEEGRRLVSTASRAAVSSTTARHTQAAKQCSANAPSAPPARPLSSPGTPPPSPSASRCCSQPPRCHRHPGTAGRGAEMG